MSDTPAPAAPAAPDLAGAGNEPAPVAAPAVDAPIDLNAVDVDPASKLGKELAAARAKYGKMSSLDPQMQKAILALVDGVAAGDADAVTNWLEQSLVSYAGEDRITQIAKRYGQTSTPIGQDGRPTTPAVPATAPGDDAPLTAAQLQTLLDQREQAQAQARQQEAIANANQEIAAEIFAIGIDPDSPTGRAVWMKTAEMSTAAGRYVPISEGFAAWKAEVQALLNPPVVPEGTPSAVSPNGAPAANPMGEMSPRDRVMARIQRNAGVGGPA